MTEKLIIPFFNSRVSPRLDYAEHFFLFDVKDRKIVRKESISIITKNRLERINRLTKLNPSLIICNGVTERCYTELIKSQIVVIPWVKGEIDNIIEKYLMGFYRESGKYKFGNKTINRK